VRVTGTGFPANTDVDLVWRPGIGGARARSDGDGAFQATILVLEGDITGPRALVWLAKPGTLVTVLVSLGTLQPAGPRTAIVRVRFGGR